MGVDVIASSATSCGTRRQVIASVDIPLADSCWMSLPVRRVIGLSAPGVGGTVVLHLRVAGVTGMVPSGSAVRRRKCFLIGQSTEVNVCPCVAL